MGAPEFPVRPQMILLLAEGLTVGALVHGRVHFMGTNQNMIQRAVVLALAVMGTLMDGTLDTLVCVAIHNVILLYLV